MRLYCNVLWAHWVHICRLSSDDDTNRNNAGYDPILIFGNSFHAYDERMISSQQRMDSINGMLRLVQFINEKAVYVDSKNRDVEDSLRMIDRVFNDCNVISFSVNKDTVFERPKEFSHPRILNIMTSFCNQRGRQGITCHCVDSHLHPGLLVPHSKHSLDSTLTISQLTKPRSQVDWILLQTITLANQNPLITQAIVYQQLLFINIKPTNIK
jgi:hypothetical protein